MYFIKVLVHFSNGFFVFPYGFGMLVHGAVNGSPGERNIGVLRINSIQAV
jgi:hypothetical protein